MVPSKRTDLWGRTTTLMISNWASVFMTDAQTMGPICTVRVPPPARTVMENETQFRATETSSLEKTSYAKSRACC